ncbi:MAG: serine/threonine protein kinase [Verrucomicrobiae bacterium]|nr:serine/threonine protein kinase [Verrucomicrobiae bacterium]
MNPEDIQIKDYQIHLPPLGEGSYGRVFRATYRGISDRALKIFRPGGVDLSTMARELEKLSSVAEHHGIVTLHDFDLLNAPPYYAMGLHADQRPGGVWETRTLERLCGHTDQREAWRLLREIADALAYLHRHHIVHCDVKPSNILLTDETPFRVKICDFGQSRGDALEGFRPAGTPLYAAPEQLRNPRDSAEGKGFRWDVYSFGVVAHKLVTGKLPRLQDLADTERRSFDPEATVAEASIDGTLAESRVYDGERVARRLETESTVRWPPGLRIHPQRRELIERCLNLDPRRRFADMREVFSEMQEIDQQRAVRRARRLNLLFAALLVICLWASGLALIQARRAHQATADAMKSREQAEELVFFIVNKLNREELSGPSLDKLYEHIADNAETYLDNLPKSRRSSTLLRISANTASLRGRQALENGDLEGALEKFRKAYEIRSQLAGSEAEIPELASLASVDLMEIGAVLEQLGRFDEALDAYDQALDWRVRDVDLDLPLPLPELRRVTECHVALANAHERAGDNAKAGAALQRAVALHDITARAATDALMAPLGRDLLPLLGHLGRLQLAGKDTAGAEATYERLKTVALTLENAVTDDSGDTRAEALAAQAEALNALGRLKSLAADGEAAMALFRDEIRIRQQLSDERPFDSRIRLALADACANLGQSLDRTDRAQRTVALYHLQQAVAILSRLPNELRESAAVDEKILDWQEQISAILEMDE